MSASTEAFSGTGLLLAVAFLSELAMLVALAVLGSTIGHGRIGQPPSSAAFRVQAVRTYRQGVPYGRTAPGIHRRQQ